MEWTPVAEGEVEATAQTIIDCIANQLRSCGAAAPSGDLALFWAYRSGSTESAEDADEFERAYLRLLDDLDRVPFSLELLQGRIYYAWCAVHVGDGDGVFEYVADTNAEILNALRAQRWGGGFDVMSGLAGLGIYALELHHAGERTFSNEALPLISKHLADMAVRTETGSCWHVAADALPPPTRQKHPDGYYPLGLAHGTAGVVGVLAKMTATGLVDATSLAVDAMRWLECQALPENPYNRYPMVVGAGATLQPSRTAWCWGDLGMVTTLASAARALGQDDALWLRHGMACAERDFKNSGVDNPAVCHGALGNAQLFQRLYVASHNQAFANAAVRCIEHAFGYPSPRWGIYTTPGEEDGSRVRGLLHGSIGIALCLLAAVEPHSPEWGRVLGIAG